MATDGIGIYIHVPFCKRKCNYCDFCSAVPHSGELDEYLSALLYEISSYRKSPKIKASTVFFGGGTPSLLPSEFFKKIRIALDDSFEISSEAEITAEVNPGTVTQELMQALVSAGVNRISIGVQSIHENELKILGRIHDSSQIKETVKLVKASGIDNFSVDLMYGIPEQTIDSFLGTLDEIVALSPTHISCYGLMIEEGTPFYEMREGLNLPNEDAECDMYYAAHEKLEAHGYVHYEISNYALPGYESRHNLKYWHREEYIGLGPSAHSFFLGKRFYNSNENNEYFSKKVEKYRREDNAVLSEPDFEYAMLHLRLSEGIDLSEYEKVFGKSFLTGREALISKFSDAGLISRKENSISLTDRGFYLSNAIMAELL